MYEAMGCRGLARVDFFLEKGGRVVFNEINTLPGFTQISMYPKLWEECGLVVQRPDRPAHRAGAGRSRTVVISKRNGNNEYQ